MSIDKCIMDVLPICAFLFGQTEGILEKYCILAKSELHNKTIFIFHVYNGLPWQTIECTNE